jgi:hypothetical protein
MVFVLVRAKAISHRPGRASIFPLEPVVWRVQEIPPFVDRYASVVVPAMMVAGFVGLYFTSRAGSPKDGVRILVQSEPPFVVA